MKISNKSLVIFTILIVWGSWSGYRLNKTSQIEISNSKWYIDLNTEFTAYNQFAKDLDKTQAYEKKIALLKQNLCDDKCEAMQEKINNEVLHTWSEKETLLYKISKINILTKHLLDPDSRTKPNYHLMSLINMYGLIHAVLGGERVSECRLNCVFLDELIFNAQIEQNHLKILKELEKAMNDLDKKIILLVNSQPLFKKSVWYTRYIENKISYRENITMYKNSFNSAILSSITGGFSHLITKQPRNFNYLFQFYNFSIQLDRKLASIN